MRTIQLNPPPGGLGSLWSHLEVSLSAVGERPAGEQVGGAQAVGGPAEGGTGLGLLWQPAGLLYEIKGVSGGHVVRHQGGAVALLVRQRQQHQRLLRLPATAAVTAKAAATVVVVLVLHTLAIAVPARLAAGGHHFWDLGLLHGVGWVQAKQWVLFYAGERGLASRLAWAAGGRRSSMYQPAGGNVSHLYTSMGV